MNGEDTNMAKELYYYPVIGLNDFILYEVDTMFLKQTVYRQFVYVKQISQTVPLSHCISLNEAVEEAAVLRKQIRIIGVDDKTITVQSTW